MVCSAREYSSVDLSRPARQEQTPGFWSGSGSSGARTSRPRPAIHFPLDSSHSLEPLWIGLTESWLLEERASSSDFLGRETVRERIAT